MKIISESEFQEAIIAAVSTKGAQDLADELHVSRLSIERWAKGTSIPFISIRAVIIKHLRDSL